jgi:hypothetical protein
VDPGRAAADLLGDGRLAALGEEVGPREVEDLDLAPVGELADEEALGLERAHEGPLRVERGQPL